jgi:hypothetical protein
MSTVDLNGDFTEPEFASDSQVHWTGWEERSHFPLLGYQRLVPNLQVRGGFLTFAFLSVSPDRRRCRIERSWCKFRI